MAPVKRSLVKAILRNPDEAKPRLEELRMIVAQRIDDTESARDTASLARVVLDVEAALRSLSGASGPGTVVDDLISRRAARGAR